jgi:hypothetical protein
MLRIRDIPYSPKARVSITSGNRSDTAFSYKRGPLANIDSRFNI